MIYLATSSTPAIREATDDGLLGRLTTMSSNKPNGEMWAADNECFTHPERFNLGTYCKWLQSFDNATIARCLFATCPDVVGEPLDTLYLSNSAADDIAACGYKPALVLQDGMHTGDIPWQLYGAVFVGGTTDWKLSYDAWQLVREARWRGMWTHMGRVNSLERCKLAASWGIGSVDGTFLSFGPDANFPKLLSWIRTLRNLDRQETLWEVS